MINSKKKKKWYNDYRYHLIWLIERGNAIRENIFTAKVLSQFGTMIIDTSLPSRLKENYLQHIVHTVCSFAPWLATSVQS